VLYFPQHPQREDQLLSLPGDVAEDGKKRKIPSEQVDPFSRNLEWKGELQKLFKSSVSGIAADRPGLEGKHPVIADQSPY
jgi:hypothetical protein